MKSSSWRFEALVAAALLPFLAAALWIWHREGFDWFVAGCLVASTAWIAVFIARARRVDPRLPRLEQLVREVAAGKFDGRVTQIGAKDSLGSFCWQMNNMLDQLEACFREQAAVWRNAGAGKYFRRAQSVGMHGMFREALDGTNSSLAELERNARVQQENRKAAEGMQEEVGRLIRAASRGDFSEKMDESGKDGFFLHLARDLNALSDTTRRGLDEVGRVLRAVAGGDLTQRVEGRFEGIFATLGDHANATVLRLKETVGQIQKGARSIDEAAHNIAQWNQDLSGRTDMQSKSLLDTTASMEELSATVKQNAQHAQQANQLATDSNLLASRSGEMVRRVMSTMSEIQDSSHRIVNIVGVIESIAFQTNILALNAAIEAARAGAEGRGFAVVAAEVRNLAQRVAASAKQIKELIDSAAARVEQGVTLAGEAGGTMDEVVTSFEQVARLVTDITAATREQAIGIENVTSAFNQIDEVTRRNSALVAEAAESSERLEGEAGHLLKAVESFRLATESAPASRRTQEAMAA